MKKEASEDLGRYTLRERICVVGERSVKGDFNEKR